MSKLKKILATITLAATVFGFMTAGVWVKDMHALAEGESAPVHVSDLFRPMEGMSKGTEHAAQATAEAVPNWLLNDDPELSMENKGALMYIDKTNADLATGNILSNPSVLQTKPFAISDNTADDLLIRLRPAPSINFYEDKSEGGSKTANDVLEANLNEGIQNIVITVRDAYFPDNYFEVSFAMRRGAGTAHYDFGNAAVRTFDEEFSTWHGARANGTLYAGPTRAATGALVPVSFWGKYEDWIEIYYDAADNKLSTVMCNTARVLDNKGDPVVIRDFNSTYVGKVDKNVVDEVPVWGGFESGFATIDIRYDRGESSTNMLITHLDGLNLATDEQGNLHQAAVNDYNDNPDSYFAGLKGELFDRGLISYSLPMVSKFNLLASDVPDATLSAEYTVKVKRNGTDVTDTVVSGLTEGKWSEGATFNPKHTGYYTFEYDNGSETLEAEFIVKSSTAVTDLLEGDGNISFTYDKSPPSFMSGSAGLGINLTDDAQLKVNNPVKLSDLNQSTPIVSYLVTPSETTTVPGGEELKNITVTLTDVNNPEKYIKIKNNASGLDNTNSFVNAAAAGQEYGGLKNGGPQKGNFRSQSQFHGTAIHPVFNGLKSNPVSLYYYDNKVFAYQDFYSAGVALIRDFNDKTHLLTNDIAFEGFESDSVYVTITFEDVSKNTGIILYSVAGQQLSSELIDDTTAPEIIIDQTFFMPNIANGEVNTPYNIPAATALDFVSGDTTDNLSVQVYKDYGTDDEAEQTVSGGAFIPTEPGSYTMVFTAFDPSLNGAVTEIAFDVYKKLGYISIVPSFDLPVQAEVGESLALPTISVQGGSGNYVLNIDITTPDGKTAAAGNTLMLTRQGIYNVTYTVTDWLGTTQIFTKTIKAYYGDTKSLILEDAVVPHAIGKGKTLVLPKVNAVDNVSFIPYATPAPVEVWVSENGGDFIKLGAGLTHKPTATSGYITTRYKTSALLDPSRVVTKEYRTDIINTVKMGDFFYDRQGDITVSYKIPTGGFAKEAYFSTDTNGAAMQFINKLPANNLRVTFTNPDLGDYSRLTVRLTDSANALQVLSIVIEAGTGETSRVYLPGVSVGHLMEGNLKANAAVSLRYTGGNTLYDASSNVIGTITGYDNGMPFDGFTSGLVYMEIIFDGIASGGSAGLKINNLCNHPTLFENINTNIRPMLTLEYTINSYHNLGDTIILPKAFAVDLMDSDTVASLSITAPDGTTVLAETAAADNYPLRVTKYGVYTVNYVAKNSAGLLSSSPVYITVHDTVAPVLEFNGSVRTEYSADDELELVDVRATDNITKSEDMAVKVYLIDSLYRVIPIKADGYEFAKAGEYTLRFFAEDAAKNYVIRDFTINVQ